VKKSPNNIEDMLSRKTRQIKIEQLHLRMQQQEDKEQRAGSITCLLPINAHRILRIARFLAEKKIFEILSNLGCLQNSASPAGFDSEFVNKKQRSVGRVFH